MVVGKKRIIKNYNQLPEEIILLVKEKYPEGYEDSLITFQMPDGNLASALPLETDEVYYLIKMPTNSIPAEDDDLDSSEPATDEFESLENLQIADDSDEDDD
jgi:hypothetical protein